MSAASIANVLGADAAAFAESTDPPAPAGDLKAEVDKFTTLEACVAERAQTDPLVGDALEAIGYDTFLRDACRILESLKSKDVRKCAPIESSSLRARCESFVAMATGQPDRCPFEITASPNAGREPTCLAVASRDARLCAGETRARRPGCEALAAKDEKKCAPSPTPREKKACERNLLRWRSTLTDVLPTGAGGAGAGAGVPTRPTGRIEVHGVDGAPDPASPTTDLASDAERGVVLTREPLGAVRLRIGSLFALGAVPRAVGSQQTTTRIGFELVLAKEAPGDAKIDRVELEIPGTIELTAATLRTTLKATVTELDATRGGKLRIVIDGSAPTTVGVPPRTYRVHVELTTFVRDVVGRGPTSPTAPTSTK
ncbi:MAG: hypothetical protein JWM74_2668 [Myxococcaceae bacterium]|nr:hypothetical protein [Myxococcaceae bacterium]